MTRKDVSEGRKAVFVAGQIMFVLGIITFGSVFVTGVMVFALPGMALFMVGAVLMNIGRAGLAGSGVVLDPQRAREDLEPWSRMAGGMVKDALDESGVALGSSATNEPDFADRLRKLHALKEEGILSEEEYQREKAEILERN